MPRYELVEGTSSKFWEITLEESSFTTTYGRIGTDGQMSMKEFDSGEKARREYDKLVAEKVKKGYSLVSGDGAAAPAAPAAPKPVAAPKPAAAKEAPAKSAAPFDDEGDEEDATPEAKKSAPAPSPAPAVKPAAAPEPVAKSSKSDEPGARYFEFVDASSRKFWEITLSGTSFTTRYGRLGTEGQQSLKEYDSDDKAKREYDKLVAEKVKKGYLEK
jgi:predicted DNA-binding WGR domain protein